MIYIIPKLSTFGLSSYVLGHILKNRKLPKSTRCNVLEAYCLKCKGPHEIKDPKEITLKNGRAATHGKCGACGSKVFRIGKAT